MDLQISRKGSRMTYYTRDIEETLKTYAKFPVIAILGPRQSGKTTVAKHVFKDHVFLNLDDFELRNMAEVDPKGFLRKYENEHGIIIDEFQNAPGLLSYIKVVVDEKNRPGHFILTGSQNFLVDAKISESLAGRVGILTLLPFSLHELTENNLINTEHPEETIFRGAYPRLYIDDFQPKEVYPSYIKTYLERDVRQLIMVTNLYTFQKFVKLCAARVGQLLNFSDLAVNCGISVQTVHQWLSILEASYIIFLLRPHWTNFNKRVTKTPKLYFFDTGLVCSLLEIESAKSLAVHPMYGALFENLMIADLFKQNFNQGLTTPLYFWRDKNGDIEVDCLIDRDSQLTPIEIKSGETYTPHFFDALSKWNDIAQPSVKQAYVIYGGTRSFVEKAGTLLPWHEAGILIQMLNKRMNKK